MIFGGHSDNHQLIFSQLPASVKPLIRLKQLHNYAIGVTAVARSLQSQIVLSYAHLRESYFTALVAFKDLYRDTCIINYMKKTNQGKLIPNDNSLCYISFGPNVIFHYRDNSSDIPMSIPLLCNRHFRSKFFVVSIYKLILVSTSFWIKPLLSQTFAFLHFSLSVRLAESPRAKTCSQFHER